MADTLGIQVKIETQADVAAVQKATSEIDKLDQVTKELGGDMDRLRAKLNEAEAAIKGTGEAGTTAGANLGKGMTEGAGLARTAMENILPATNVNDLIQGAWNIGTQIGSKLGEAVQLSMDGKLDWDHLFGDGAEVDAIMERRYMSLKKVRDEHAALIEQFDHTPGEAFKEWLTAMGEAAAKTARELESAQKMAEALSKLEDAKAKAKTESDKDAIDASGQTAGEKTRQKAAIDNAADEEALEKKKAERQQELEQEIAKGDEVKRAYEASQAVTAEAKRRKDASIAIDSNPEFEKIKASGRSKDEIEKERRKRGEAAGFSDLDDPTSEDARVTQSENAERKAREKFRDSASKVRGYIDRRDVENETDDVQTREKIRNRTADAGRTASEQDKRDADSKTKGEQSSDKKEAADAGKAAKEAAKATDSSTKEMASGLKQLADMVKTKDAKMAEAFTKMAEGLKDGASAEELANIQRAMELVARSSNEAFATLGKTVDVLANATESSAKLANEALRKAQSLENKINSLRK